jgi:hypothetical protein
VLQAGDLGDVLALVALDALDDDFGGRALLALAGFGGFGFGGFLLGVFLGAFLRVDAERGEVLVEGFVGVEGGVEGWVGGREPFGAFLGGAAEFTVLAGRDMLVSCSFEVCTAFYAATAWYVHVSLAARSRTYFWRKRADAAVDYGLGRTDVRGICCVGHGVFSMG